MNKITIICILFVSSFFPTAHAKSISHVRKWNFGIYSNTLHPMKIFKKYKSLYCGNYRDMIRGIFALHPGMFSKYQFNSRFNIEVTSNIFEHIIKDIKNNASSLYFSTTEYAARANYPVKKNINFYTKLGTTLTTAINDNRFDNILILQKKKQIQPILSVGLEYLFSQYLNFNMNIDLNKSFKKIDLNNLFSILNNIRIGMHCNVYPKINPKYNIFKKIKGRLFLQHKKNIKNIKNIIYEHKNIPCVFNSSKLTPTAYRILNNLKNRILHIGKKNVFMTISGDKDSIEIKNKSIKIPLKRSLEVSNFFVKNGLFKKNTFIQGINSNLIRKNHDFCNFLSKKNFVIKKFFKVCSLDIVCKYNYFFNKK
uniref:Outer membrane protein A n=1 Tax=Buchnera aphidicola (Cinara pseudotsugae) TaxID=2518978 RepID=A0A451DFE3_9GAMM